MPSIVSQGRVSSYPGGFPSGLCPQPPACVSCGRGETYFVSNSTASRSRSECWFCKAEGHLQQAVLDPGRKLSMSAWPTGRHHYRLPWPRRKHRQRPPCPRHQQSRHQHPRPGVGENRPTFTLTTANTVKIVVSANNVGINNCVSLLTLTSLSSSTSTTATGFNFDNYEVRDTSATLNFLERVPTFSDQQCQ